MPDGVKGVEAVPFGATMFNPGTESHVAVLGAPDL